MTDQTTQAPAGPVYVVRPVFEDRYELRNAYSSPLNGSETRFAARAVNAFEPMRKALDMLSEQIKVRIDPGLLEELGRAGVGDMTIRADVLLACLRALRAADGEGQPT